MEELEGMEKVYLPNAGPYAKPVTWCSRRLTFKDYFEKFSIKLSEIQRDSRTSNKELLCNLLPGCEFPDEKLRRLTRIMDPKQFFTMPDNVIEVKPHSQNDKKPIKSDPMQSVPVEGNTNLQEEGNLAKNVPTEINSNSRKEIRRVATKSNNECVSSNQNFRNGQKNLSGFDKTQPAKGIFPTMNDILNQPSTSKGGGQIPSANVMFSAMNHLLSQPSTSKEGTQQPSSGKRKATISIPGETTTGRKSGEPEPSKRKDKGNIMVSDNDSDLAISTFELSSSDSSEGCSEIDEAEAMDRGMPDFDSPENSQSEPPSNIDSDSISNVDISANLEDAFLRRSARVKMKMYSKVKKPTAKTLLDPSVQKSSSEDSESEMPYQQRTAAEIVHEIARRTSRSNIKTLSVRGQVLIDTTERKGPKDLVPRKNFVVSFRIHRPYKHAIGQKGLRPAKCLQEIDVLNFQTLADLREKIMCEQDYQDTRGNVSNWPYAPLGPFAKDKYKAGMFYIGNTFYIDTQEGAEDYSEGIRKWAKEHFINVGETMSMDAMKVEDLNVRLGYPYVYIHQGRCEHIVIISQARLVTEKHSLHSSDYPNITKTSRTLITYCSICMKRPAIWIVMCSDRFPCDVNFMCQDCYQSYNYIDSKKIGNFKSYRWRQRGLLFH